MTEADQYGLALSTESPAAAAAWREAIDRLCALQNASGPLRRAREEDPGFALPAVYMANVKRLSGDVEGGRAILAGVDLARANERERAHVEVMELMLAGRVAS